MVEQIVLSALVSAIHKRRDPIGFARKIGVKIGDGCRLIDVNFSSEPYLVRLGNHVSATATRFETHDGGVWVFREQDPEIDIVRPITVGNNVFIGYGCIILPGVTIGDNVVIGAGSIVSRDIPSNCVAVGAPCRVLKSLDEYRAGISARSDPTKRFSRAAKRTYFLRKFGLAED